MIEDTWIDGNPHLASKRKRSRVIIPGFEVGGSRVMWLDVRVRIGVSSFVAH